MQRVAHTVPRLVAGHLDAIEGIVVARRENRSNPLNDEENGDEGEAGGQI